MRYVLFAAIALCSATAEAQARVEFVGIFHLTLQNATCIAFRDAEEPGFFRYRPPNLGDNGPSTKISVVYEYSGAENWTLASGNLVGTAYKTVIDTQVFGSGKQATTTMRIRSQTPATLTATTPKITFAGDIRNYEDPGCDVSFTASGFLK